jgi:hypothetical protein
MAMGRRRCGVASIVLGCAAWALLCSVFMWQHWLYAGIRADDIGAPAYHGPLLRPHERLDATALLLERVSIVLAVAAAAAGVGLGVRAVGQGRAALGVAGIAVSATAWLGLGGLLLLVILSRR